MQTAAAKVFKSVQSRNFSQRSKCQSVLTMSTGQTPKTQSTMSDGRKIGARTHKRTHKILHAFSFKDENYPLLYVTTVLAAQRTVSGIIIACLLAYLLHGAESFLRS